MLPCEPQLTCLPFTTSCIGSIPHQVSLLARFEPAANWQDWEVGVHGIIIHFTDPDVDARSARRSATFLPDVPLEQGWDQEQTIDALIHKAGYNGPINYRLREALSVERYESTIASITYDEFILALQQQQQQDDEEDGGLEAVAMGPSSPAKLRVAA